MSTNIADNNIDNKKWTLNDILDLIHNGYEEMEFGKKHWLTKFQEIPLGFTNFRNRTLATVAFVVTFLFSLNSLLGNDSLKFVFFAVIIVLLLYALIVYLLNTKTAKKTKTIYDKIEWSYYFP